MDPTDHSHHIVHRSSKVSTKVMLNSQKSPHSHVMYFPAKVSIIVMWSKSQKSALQSRDIYWWTSIYRHRSSEPTIAHESLDSSHEPLCCSVMQCGAVCCSVLQWILKSQHYSHVIYIHYSMGWLRWVGSLKLQVSFAEYSLFYRALLQKRPIILRRLLIVAIL